MGEESFIQGAAGDINPYARVVATDVTQQLEMAGRSLAASTIRIAQTIQTKTEPNATLDIAEDVITFKLRWDQQKFRQGLLNEFGRAVFATFAGQITPVSQLPVITALISKRIALMTMPGEPFVTFQLNWRERCPAPDAFFLGYTNGYFGYFPTIPAAAQGGYGASDSVTWVEVGAGEGMVDHAVVRIYEMLGHLIDAPVEPVSK